jgi:hypothetical protein
MSALAPLLGAKRKSMGQPKQRVVLSAQEGVRLGQIEKLK